MTVAFIPPPDYPETTHFSAFPGFRAKLPSPSSHQLPAPLVLDQDVPDSLDSPAGTPSPISTPTASTTPSPDNSPPYSPSDLPSSSVLSIYPSYEQVIADQILSEGNQTEGSCFHFYNIDLTTYNKVVALVSRRSTSHLHYYYDIQSCTISLDRLVSTLHESLTTSLALLQTQLSEWLGKQLGVKVQVYLAGTQQFSLSDMSQVHIREKCPDQGYQVVVSGKVPEGEMDSEGGEADKDWAPDEYWWFYPNIIVEIGYSELYEDLVQDAKLWLLWTPQHPVLSFILFKFEKPTAPGDFNNFSLWMLFFKIWEKY